MNILKSSKAWNCLFFYPCSSAGTVTSRSLCWKQEATWTTPMIGCGLATRPTFWLTTLTNARVGCLMSAPPSLTGMKEDTKRTSTCWTVLVTPWWWAWVQAWAPSVGVVAQVDTEASTTDKPCPDLFQNHISAFLQSLQVAKMPLAKRSIWIIPHEPQLPLQLQPPSVNVSSSHLLPLFCPMIVQVGVANTPTLQSWWPMGARTTSSGCARIWTWVSQKSEPTWKGYKTICDWRETDWQMKGQRMRTGGGEMDNEYNSPVMPLQWMKGGKMGGIWEQLREHKVWQRV